MQINKFFKVSKKERNIFKGLIFRNLMKTFITDKNKSLFHKIYNLKILMEPNIYYEDQQHISKQLKTKYRMNSKFIIRKPYYKDDYYMKPEIDVSLNINELSNKYLALMMIFMREHINSTYIYKNIVDCIYNKQGIIQYKQSDTDTQYAIWNYYNDMKLNNFIKLTQPYEYDSESD